MSASILDLTLHGGLGAEGGVGAPVSVSVVLVKPSYWRFVCRGPCETLVFWTPSRVVSSHVKRQERSFQQAGCTRQL